MSKKRAKSGSGSAGAARWESGLLATPFEEEGWTSFIGSIVPGELADKEYAAFLCSSISSGIRKLFSIITYEGLIEEVNELGNPKGKRPKDIPAFSEICETAKTHLDNNEPIPLPLLAKLVKWKLLAIKDADVKRREQDGKDTSDKDSKRKKSGKKSARGKSAKGKGKKSPEIPSPKKESKLKKRGEDDEENKYIDDEPDDGPQHYILLFGFLDASLLVLLSDLGINVNCILRLTCEDYSLFDKRKAEKEEEEEEFERPQEVIEAEQQVKAKATEELQRFWKQYEPLLLNAFKGSSLHDIARLTYEVKNEMVPKEYEDADNQAEFGTALFEDVACMIYDLLDKKRQYKNYQENMKLVGINASQSQPEIQLTASGTAAMAGAISSSAVQQAGVDSQAAPVDIRYYKDLMDTIPAESCSVPLIMHCMLEQVVATEEGKEPPSGKLHQLREDGLDHALAAHIDSISAKFNLGQPTEKTEGDEAPKMDTDTQFPVFYHYGDKTSEKLRHLDHIDGFDALKGEEAMVKLLPVSRVTKFPRPSNAVMKQRSARLHELLHKCFKEGMDTAEMDHILRKFVFESLVLRSTDSKGHVQADNEMEGEIVWDDPYIVENKKTEPVEMETVPIGMSPVVSNDQTSSPENNHSSTPSGGILKVDSKSRQGSAGSVRSSKSQVHFEDGVEAQKEVTTDDIKNSESSVFIPDKKRSPTPSLISVQDVADKPQRMLDEWCFVEHLKPNVLLQALDEARMLCPYMDTYYHRKDHSLLIVMHNPIDSERKNIITWDAKLHSNVGFRNYLEHVADYIEDWIEKEEEKYQADLREKELAAELAAAQAAAASAAASPSASRPGSSKGRNRSQSPKKSRSKSPKGRGSESPAPAGNLDPNSGSFMRPNSMKAWKVEHDKQLAEEEKKKQDKDKKGKKSARSRSASPKKDEKEEKGKDKKEEGKKRSTSGRGSRKGDKEKKDASAAEGEAKDGEGEIQEPAQPERYYPFVGYDVGNNMIHANGSVTSLFPTDGGLICCEKTQFISGDVFINTTLLKDGHALTVHILDPKDPVEEKSEKEPSDASTNSHQEDGIVPEGEDSQSQPLPAPSQKPLSSFGSLTASLNDGMVLSLSNYGKSGAPKIEEEKPKVETVIPPVASPSPPPPAASPSRGRGGSGKKGKKGAPSAIAESEKASQKPSEQPKEEEASIPEPLPAKEPEEPPFQQLFISCPNGLHVSYKLESVAGDQSNGQNIPGKMLIKQSFPSKTAGQQPCEASVQNPAMTEHCRFINSEGAVIKLMMDGRTEVLFPTGVVSKAASLPIAEKLGSPSQSREGSPQRGGSAMSNHLNDARKGNMRGAGSKASILPSMDPLDEASGTPRGIIPLEWITTTINGDRFGTKVDGTVFEEKPIMLYSARDPVTDEVMTTREDKVVIVERPDGTRIVDHSDGTRITSYTVDVEYREINGGETEETGEVTPAKVRTVQQVKVECAGYATIVFNSEDGIATTIFGNGTQVIAIPDGSYEILHHDGSRMTVDPDGCVRFTPKPEEGDDGSTVSPTVYILHHKEKVVCHVKDNKGKSYSVNWKGELLFHEEEQSSDGKTKEEGEAEGVGGEETTDETKETKEVVSHVPRYFVINSDGSGCELLRDKDLSSFFQQMEMDPATAFIQEPLPDHPDVQGLTFMKPYLTNVSDTWLLKFDEENIVPPNLRPRDFTQLPPKEMKKIGPKFGTNVGKGLAVGSRKKPPGPPPAPQCPRYLQLRQFTQYKPVDVEMRKKMEACLEAHAKEMAEKENVDAERQLKDPRSEEEKMLAGDLLAQILAQDEDQQKLDQIEGSKQEAPTNMQPPADSDVLTAMAKPVDVSNPERTKELYETATAPAPLPPPPKPHNKYTEDDWNRVRLDLQEEQANREALRKREVPPYFNSQWGKSFLAAQAATSLEEPDMEALTRRLAEGTKQGTQPPSNSLPSTPDNSPASDQQGGGDRSQPPDVNESPCGQTPKMLTLQTPREGDSPFVQGVTASPSDVRPTNPTPGHAGGVGTPTQVRPTNPTPAHASQPQPLNRPGNPTASSDGDVPARNLPSDTPSSYASFPNHPSTIPEQVEEQDDGNAVVAGDNQAFNSEVTLPVMSSETLLGAESEDIKITPGDSQSNSVSGTLKKSPVRLPAAIQGQKPGALPNQQFQAVEEPVRRKVMTSSLAGVKVFGDKKVSANRGFELVPGEVFFGELREGCTYIMSVNLKNIGIDSCRYRIKQPPPATGLQVIYKPGPVAAGMKAQLQIQLYAIAVGVEGESGRGSIGHHLEITTETDFIFLPVSAYILTAYEYDELCRTKGRPYLAPGVQLLSNKPPSREGIIRPRKESSKKVDEEVTTNT